MHYSNLGKLAAALQIMSKTIKKINSHSSTQSFISRRSTSSLNATSGWSYTYLRIFGAIGEFWKTHLSSTNNGHRYPDCLRVFLLNCKDRLKVKLYFFLCISGIGEIWGNFSQKAQIMARYTQKVFQIF